MVKEEHILILMFIMSYMHEWNIIEVVDGIVEKVFERRE
jgi:hypothetical protein